MFYTCFQYFNDLIDLANNKRIKCDYLQRFNAFNSKFYVQKMNFSRSFPIFGPGRQTRYHPVCTSATPLRASPPGACIREFRCQPIIFVHFQHSPISTVDMAIGCFVGCFSLAFHGKPEVRRDGRCQISLCWVSGSQFMKVVSTPFICFANLSVQFHSQRPNFFQVKEQCCVYISTICLRLLCATSLCLPSLSW